MLSFMSAHGFEGVFLSSRDMEVQKQSTQEMETFWLYDWWYSRR